MREMSTEEILGELKHSLSEEGKAEAAEAALERARAKKKKLQDIGEYIRDKDGRGLASVIRGLFRNIEAVSQDGLSGEVLVGLCGIYDLSLYQIKEAAYSSDPVNNLLELFT